MISKYISDEFGSKKSLLKSVQYFSMHRILGYMNEYGRIDFKRVNRLIFVCSGNICRSPTGEVYARSLGVASESFGLDCRGGDPADERAAKFAETHGLDLSNHITRHISEYQAAEGDLIVVMEPSHVLKMPANVLNDAQMTLAPLWGENTGLYLHDPYSCNTHYFNKCLAILLASVKQLRRRIDA